MDANYSTNDAPTLDCQFGNSEFIQNLAEEVRNSPSPKTLSITGCWGSGKTSALAQLYFELTGESPPGYGTARSSSNSPIKGVWFEAWRYQSEAVPIVALLHAIKNQFSSTEKFIDKAGKLASISLLGAFTVF